MKHLASVALLIPLSGCMSVAQIPAPLAPPVTTYAAAPAAAPLFTAEQLDQLLAPIALYPDALLALILPASTNPSDVVLAARFLQAGGPPDQADVQPWDDSVRALAHYPQVVQWMDQNLAWTKQLGDAFNTQPGDIMNAVQRLRARARAAGTLASTPQQEVMYQGETILIVPTDPNVLYVPYYDPAVVYDLDRGNTTYVAGSFFSFSAGFATGWWMSYGLDWPSRRLWVVNHNERERYWREHHRDWQRPDLPRGPDHDREIHVWNPQPDNNRRPTNYPGHVAPVKPPFDSHRQPTAPEVNPHHDAVPPRWNPNAPSERAPTHPGPTGAPSPRPQGEFPNEGRHNDGARPEHRQPAANARPNPIPAPASTPPPAVPPAYGPRGDRNADHSGDHHPNFSPTRPVSPAVMPGQPPYHPAMPVNPGPGPVPSPGRQPDYRLHAPAHQATPPPPPRSPTPAPASNQQSGSNDDDHKKPPFIPAH